LESRHVDALQLRKVGVGETKESVDCTFVYQLTPAEVEMYQAISEG